MCGIPHSHMCWYIATCIYELTCYVCTWRVGMHGRATLLLCVATASGLMSAFHMYLLPSRPRDSISVALEIPLLQSQHSTSLELNIQSVKYPEQSKETAEQQANKTRRLLFNGRSDSNYIHRGISHEMMRESVLLSPPEEGLPELGEDRDDYVVLLDTGDYELKERDMDRPSEDPVPPTHHHRHPKHTKRRQHTVSTRQPFTTDTPSTGHQKMSGEIGIGHTEKLSHAGSFAYSKNIASQPEHVVREENKVYARQPFTTDTPSTGHQQVTGEAGISHADSIAESKIIDSQSEEKENVVKKVYAMTKEEYYARQATASSPPPVTHPPPHHTHTNTAHTTPPQLCTHPPCLQYLSATEKYVFNKCQKRTVPRHSSGGVPLCQCRFRDGKGKKRVALVSLPGSGNTWVRGLLEKATGLCTGSIYCDRTLREGGFCGEGLHGGSLVAVKTHDSSLQWTGGKRTDSGRPPFDKAIFLIRNPFRANIAEWNRQMSKKYALNQTGSSHVKYVSSKAFFGMQPGWQSLVKYQSHKWRLMIGSNVRARAVGRPILLVFFEELKQSPATELTRMLEFLEVPSSPDIINNTVMDGFTKYYRNHTDTFEHYTAEQRQFVNSIISSTVSALQSKAQDIASHIREYLQH